MLDKDPEYWAALFGMVVYMSAQRLEGENLGRRAAKIASSASMTLAMSPSLADKIYGGEVVSVVVIMIVFTFGIDAILGVVKDATFIKEVIRIWLNGRDKP